MSRERRGFKRVAGQLITGNKVNKHGDNKNYQAQVPAQSGVKIKYWDDQGMTGSRGNYMI